MNIFQKFYNNIESRIIRNTDDRRIMVEAAIRNGDNGNKESNLYSKLTREAINLRAQTLKNYKDAVAAATDPEEPAWAQLWTLYTNLMLDNHLASVIDSRILYVQRSPFKLVDDAGNENEDISWLLERPWHDELIYKVLFSKYQGKTLLELYNLTPDGELAEIEEIPQPYFNTKKGLITPDIDGNKGWSYREGIFSTFYLQIGRDDDLGMLSRLAPTVLAKKLAMGSYQDYIEKFGIPPLFITTDREDDNRLNQLFEAAKNFKSNHFMVGRGQEKFDVGNVSGSGVAPFDALINRVNDEISKRILGGSGLTDEKAFVGSAEIQFRLAKDRYESDKLFYKYIFNQHVKPMLIALSPVYKPLEKFYFEWDNTETLDMKAFIEAVNILSNHYDIDPEQIEQTTGIKILGIKQPANPFGGPSNEDGNDNPKPSGGKGGKKQKDQA